MKLGDTLWLEAAQWNWFLGIEKGQRTAVFQKSGRKLGIVRRGQRVIAPAEEKFYPAIASLRWREEHLTTKY